jgi:hypothetical protein
VLGYYGSGIPNYVFLENDLPGVPRGYAWDMCNSEVLLTRVSVKNGRIVLPDGMSYALLSLPDHQDISLPVLKKIEELVREGAILVGSPPERATGLTGYPESDREVWEIVKRLWGPVDGKTVFLNTFGKGKVYGGKTIGQVLRAEQIDPDFTYLADENVDLDYIHRSAESADIYFITNRWSRQGIDDRIYRYLTDLPDRCIKAICSFRLDGERKIERFDPLTGTITSVNVYKREGDRYLIPVTLTPEGSTCFVFRRSEERRHVVNIEKDGKRLIAGNDPVVTGASALHVKEHQAEIGECGEYRFTWSDGKISDIQCNQLIPEYILAGKWKIHFMEDPLLGESFETETKELKSWTDFSNRKIKYFSGRARYSQVFFLSPEIFQGGRIYIDLGNLHDLATIRLNGEDITTCWMPPFRADVTDHLKKGDNFLEIEVANMWTNRLIGDGKLQRDERLTRTNIHKFDSPDAEKYLRISGLLGPVKLEFSTFFYSEQLTD